MRQQVQTCRKICPNQKEGSKKCISQRAMDRRWSRFIGRRLVDWNAKWIFTKTKDTALLAARKDGLRPSFQNLKTERAFLFQRRFCSSQRSAPIAHGPYMTRLRMDSKWYKRIPGVSVKRNELWWEDQSQKILRTYPVEKAAREFVETLARDDGIWGLALRLNFFKSSRTCTPRSDLPLMEWSSGAGRCTNQVGWMQMNEKPCRF